MKFNKISKWIFISSLLMSTFITSSLHLSSYHVQSKYTATNIIDKLIESEIKKAENSPITIELIQQILLSLAENLDPTNDNDVSQKFNSLKDNLSEKMTYESILASNLASFDFSNLKNETPPKDLSILEVIDKYVSFAKEEAEKQYDDYLDDFHSISGTKKNPIGIKEAFLNLPDQIHTPPAGSMTYDFDIEVGDILYYKKPGEKIGNFVDHVSMITASPDTNSGDDVWEYVDATPSKNVYKHTINNLSFSNYLKKYEITVLKTRFQTTSGSLFFPTFEWIYPIELYTQDMVRRINTKVNLKYEDPKYSSSWKNDEWYCSELIWYATSVWQFGVPSTTGGEFDELISPWAIYSSPKTKRISSWG